ncbi:MAG: hypothetical protein Q9184_004025 [Pyrenodesmia sp. 2 TL-2023]
MASHLQPSRSVEREEDAQSEDVSSSGGDDERVELLVTSREKRSTAGMRMSTLLEREGDDELELLFAEDEQEEDDEFEEEDAEDGSDVQLDSASSDDEQGPANDDDNLDGEKELQRQTRIERQKKRKAQDAFLKPGLVHKKVRVASRPGARGLTAAPITPAPKSKKTERSSWLPTPEEGPVRASSRKQTVQNKEIVHSRLVASEKRRMKQLQIMQEAAKRKEASRPKAMTQAQRMEEAARTERLNAKSLNRWETAEKKRSEEQKAKLEALHNRQLTGPVISWWSGMARWVNGKLKQVGWKSIKEVEAERTFQAHQEPDRVKNDNQSEDQRHPITNHDTIMAEDSGLQPQASIDESDHLAENENAAATPHVTVATPQGPPGFLDGIHYYASLPEKPSSNANHEPSGIPIPSTPQDHLAPSRDEALLMTGPSSAYMSKAPTIEYSARTVVRLEHIDVNGQRLPELQNHVLLKKQRLTQAEKQSKSSVRDSFYRIPVNLKFQKECVSCVRSRNSRHGTGTPRQV